MSANTTALVLVRENRWAAARAQTAPPTAAAGVDRLHDELTKPGELRSAGPLTDEEFAAQEARLLASP